MGADENIKTIRMVYEAFGRGDVDAVVASVADDVDWATEASGRGAPWAAVSVLGSTPVRRQEPAG